MTTSYLFHEHFDETDDDEMHRDSLIVTDGGVIIIMGSMDGIETDVEFAEWLLEMLPAAIRVAKEAEEAQS